jgi:hypothetical protein
MELLQYTITRKGIPEILESLNLILELMEYF